MLGIALHTWGSAAKFFADHMENTNLGPFEAVRSTGAMTSKNRIMIFGPKTDGTARDLDPQD